MDSPTENDLQLLISLKQEKKEGSLDSEKSLENQKLKWRNLIEYKTFENWLIFKDEEHRLNALELLTLSRKSTLYFTSQEFDLIMLFLKFNMREKMHYVPLIKKVIKRVNGSYAVIRRQVEKEEKIKKLQELHPEANISCEGLSSDATAQAQMYKNFIRSLHNICMENLYPSAVNIRKKSSLQILCLMDEFLSSDLKNSLWTPNELKDLFNCLLLDTYEINKDMAYRLINSSGLVESIFDSEESSTELVKVGVELANSIRPLDSITASYMLKISLLLPNVQSIILNLIRAKDANSIPQTEYKIQEEIVYDMILLLKTYLEKPVKLATENIVIAASKHSLYGYVFCTLSIMSTINLKNIVDDKCWRNIIRDLVNMCFELNTAVSQIVNSSSPEGHLPMDLDPRHLDSIRKGTEEIIVTPQMVLLCSWRTVKEISLFFGYLTSNASIFNEKNNTGILSENQFQEIGNTLVTMLSETKHRGAFEQAHVGFSQLCGRLWHVPDEEKFLKQLPKYWLQHILLAVIGLSSENSKLCATRRSAGVPYMVQALVTTEIKKRWDLKTLTFHSVMRILLKLVNIDKTFTISDAKKILYDEPLFNDCEENQCLRKIIEECSEMNEITEIKTHTLNILRALYRDCLLGEIVRDYVPDGFIAAFKSYESASWAERNAATMLFSSLVVRVFGVQRTKDHVNLTMHNRMTGNNFFEKFPSLLPFLLNELKIFVYEPEEGIKPKVQSILLILSRLYPGVTCENADEDWKIDQFIDLVSKCGKSKVYKTRELAARALIPLLTKDNVLPIFSSLLNSMTSRDLSFNLLHGYTLQLLELVKSDQFISVNPPSDELQVFINFFVTKILQNLESNNDQPACFPVSTGILEILQHLSITKCQSWIYKDQGFLNLLEKIDMHLTTEGILKKRPGIELYEAAAMDLIASALENVNYSGPLKNNEFIATQFWEKILNYKNTELLKIVWSKIIHIIKISENPILFDLMFMDAVRKINKKTNDPYLQEAEYKFIHDAINEMENNCEFTQYTFSTEIEKNRLCMYIFFQLDLQLKSKTFYPRGEFFKLLGKLFGFLLKRREAIDLSKDMMKNIYEPFLNYSSMESNLDCRIAISEILYDLFIHKMKNDDIYFMLNWWTTFLQLLYDDSYQVRSNVAQVIAKFYPETRLNCEEVIVNKFFSKFVDSIGHKGAIAAAFFCWSMNSADVVLEEMDELEVFNKSSIYECFEPLQITKKCVAEMKSISPNKDDFQATLATPIKEWIQKQLNLESNIKFESVHELILVYKMPGSVHSLKRILDPIYPARVIKEIAYHEIRNLVMSEKAGAGYPPAELDGASKSKG